MTPVHEPGLSLQGKSVDIGVLRDPLCTQEIDVDDVAAVGFERRRQQPAGRERARLDVAYIDAIHLRRQRRAVGFAVPEDFGGNRPRRTLNTDQARSSWVRFDLRL